MQFQKKKKKKKRDVVMTTEGPKEVLSSSDVEEEEIREPTKEWDPPLMPGSIWEDSGYQKHPSHSQLFWIVGVDDVHYRVRYWRCTGNLTNLKFLDPVEDPLRDTRTKECHWDDFPGHKHHYKFQVMDKRK